jgi:Ca2+-binding EF-hand superfamily protein
MKLPLSAFVLSALVCVAPSAFAQSRGASMMISMMDSDEDGRVSANEWIEASYPPLAFIGDGLKLTEADYADTLTGTPEDTAKKAREAMVKFDANKDGFLSTQEFRDTFAADFHAMDTDKNDDLTIDEYDKAQGQQMQDQAQHQH